MRQWSAGENAVFAVVLLYPWGLIVSKFCTDWCIVGLVNKSNIAYQFENTCTVKYCYEILQKSNIDINSNIS